MATEREEMEKAVREMLKDKGCLELYEGQIEEVGYAVVRWQAMGGTPESLVYALVNKTLPLQALLDEARVVKVTARDGQCVMENKEDKS